MREQKRLLEEQMAKMEADQALLHEYTRERQVRVASSQYKKGRGMRWLGRVAPGLAGGAAIVVTGGLATPLVAAGALAVEGALQNDREKDKKKLRAAMET